MTKPTAAEIKTWEVDKMTRYGLTEAALTGLLHNHILKIGDLDWWTSIEELAQLPFLNEQLGMIVFHSLRTLVLAVESGEYERHQEEMTRSLFSDQRKEDEFRARIEPHRLSGMSEGEIQTCRCKGDEPCN